MVYNKTNWIACFKQAVADTKGKPSSGRVAAIAAIRYIRDGLLTDQGFKAGDRADAIRETDETMAAIVESLNELIKAVNKEGAEDGFLGNASAAAKAAGFKTEFAADVDLDA